LATGIVSPIIDGTSTIPALAASSLSGLAFVDENADGQRNEGESALVGTEVIVRAADGSPLFGGQVNAGDFADGGLPNDLAGVTLVADGVVLSGQIGSFVSDIVVGQRVFHAFDAQRDNWIERWSKKAAFEASFDSPVGEVRLDAIGLDDASFARLEAYDAAGQMLGRVTSDAIGLGESSTLHVTDPHGRIASIRAFGHAKTPVALSGLHFGFEDSVVTDPSGAWRLQNLPDGAYRVEMAPERLIHQFAQPSIEVQVASGSSELIAAAAERVDSPRHNQLLSEDANQDGKVTANDALVIINDLDRFAPRMLQASDLTGFDVDVSNDGFISVLDALLVINHLARQHGGLGESESGNFPAKTGKSSDFVSGAVRDEDRDKSNLDATDLPSIGPPPIASENSGFTLVSAQKVDSIVRPEPSDAIEPAESITPITAEIPEPFRSFVI
jgi:hypothetical protein